MSRKSLNFAPNNCGNSLAGSCHNTVIRVYDDAGNVIETHEHNGEFMEW
jgi:hypothetical protein